jgi:tRNA uridine 5-carbamoylmethylation protein Kti12
MYLVAGLPGTGKTTLARMLTKAHLHKGENAVHYEADQFFEDAKGAYVFLPSQLKNAHKWCQEQTRNAAVADTPVIVVSNTFVKSWEADAYVDIAQAHGYEVVNITMDNDMWTDAQLAKRNVHKVPQEKIAQMRQNWEA